MTMTSEEIVRDYTRFCNSRIERLCRIRSCMTTRCGHCTIMAANKSKQIKILADLNCCSPSEIRQVLATILHRRVERLRRIKSCMTARCGHCTIMAGVAGVKMPERIVKRKPVPEAKASAPVPAPAFFDRVETILSALPEELSDDAASCVQNLLQTLFAEYLHQRLMGRR